MTISNAAFAALAGFLMVFFAQVFCTAPSAIAQAWGWVLVVLCATGMVYFMQDN